MGSLYKAYKNDRFYWESVIQLFSLFFLGSPFVFSAEPHLMVFSSIIIATFYGTLVLVLQPFRFPRTNMILPIAMSALVFLLCSGLVFLGGSFKVYHEGIAWFIIGFTFIVIILLVYFWASEVQYTNYVYWEKIYRLKPILESRIFKVLFPVHARQETVQDLHYSSRNSSRSVISGGKATLERAQKSVV